MEKKVLAVACSSILGLSAGMLPALAEVQCGPQDENCYVSEGDSVIRSGRTFGWVDVTDPGSSFTGSQLTVNEWLIATYGAKASLADSFVANISVRDDSTMEVTDSTAAIVRVNGNSSIIMNGGEITHGGGTPDPRDGSSYFEVLDNSTLTLNNVAVINHGGNEVMDSAFTMTGGQLTSTFESGALRMWRSTADLDGLDIKGGIGVYDDSTFTGRDLNISIAQAISPALAELVILGSKASLVNSTLEGSLQVNDSEFSMDGGSIHSKIGLFYYTRNSDITLNDVTMTAEGEGLAIYVDNDSRFKMTGGSITSAGEAFRANGETTLTNVTINSEDSAIWQSDRDGQLTITGSDINVGSKMSGGIGGVRIDGRALIDDTRIEVQSGWNTSGVFVYGGELTARGFDILTHSNLISGVAVQAASYDPGNVRYGTALLENGGIRTQGASAYGIRVNGGASLKADDVSIVTSGDHAAGVLLREGAVTLDAVDIEVNSANGLDVNGYVNSRLEMTGGSIAVKGESDEYGQDGHGVFAEGHAAEVVLNGVSITTLADNSTAVRFKREATGAFNNVQINAQGRGIVVESNSSATLDNSMLTVSGADSHALGFVATGSDAAGSITLDQSTVTSAQSAAVLAAGRNGRLNLVNSTLAGDYLMQANASVEVKADHSQLSGHVVPRWAGSSTAASLTLDNDSTWTLRPSGTGMVRSDLATLTLNNSSIHFDPNAGGLYQTLVVGSNSSNPVAVYNAGANAQVSLNTWLNEGGGLSNQQTDRLLINGDVSGQTLLTVNEVQGSPGGATGSLAYQGISLVQVSGSAQADSFVLNGGYVTMNAEPWRYELKAYGPGSANGEADTTQRLVEGTNPHWDWRLQSEYVTEVPPPPTSPPLTRPHPPGPPALMNPPQDTALPVRAVVPQVSSYLSAPGALFRSGLAQVRPPSVRQPLPAERWCAGCDQ